MTQAHKTPGNKVVIKEDMFGQNSWAYPYYEEYIGHVFEVISIEVGGHISLKCISGLLDKDDQKTPRRICVHDDEIKSVPKKKV